MAFGSRLKEERQRRELSLEDVARVTKIPVRSLEHLEAGRFDQLPGPVFVRGFLRSYARCVGLDAEEIVRAYGELEGGAEAAKARASAPFLGRGAAARSTAMGPRAESLPRQSPGHEGETAAAGDSGGAGASAPAEAAQDSLTRKRSLLSQRLAEARRGTHRQSLTLAVIILVVVATLTLSWLLRRPSHGGDGVSALDVRTQVA